ncbi:MAG: ribosome-binding factor A [Pseudomonadota bacterium]|jgi:ribosome-binding factor A|nr:ribosome-binding factor A [Alphaproteobacteria bacterium]
MLKLFTPAKAPSYRQERVAEEIRFLLSQQLQKDCLPIEYAEGGDLLKPSVPITITALDVSPDLRHAQIGIMPLGGIEQELAIKFMDANAWHLRKFLAKQLKIRVTPTLCFYLDNRFEQAAKIDSLIMKSKNTQKN